MRFASQTSRRASGIARWLLALCVTAWMAACSGGGCGGCGGSLPGGFPAASRTSGSVALHLSAAGLQSLDSILSTQLTAALGGGGGGGPQGFEIPCNASNFSIGVANASVLVCDLNGSGGCDNGDMDPALRGNVAGHGLTCRAVVSLDSIDVEPVAAGDGATLLATAQIRVNSGQIPISLSSPLGSAQCNAEFDTDGSGSPTLPLVLRFLLTVDPASGDLLRIDLSGVDDLVSAIEPGDLDVSGGGLCGLLRQDVVKQLLFDRLKGELTLNLRDQVDALRCQPCSEGCPGGTQCQNDVCYSEYRPDTNPANDRRACPARKLGTEGRLALGAQLASVNAPAESAVDYALYAGGRTPDGRPDVRVDNGGLALGFLGGSRTPLTARCVRPATWAQRTAAAPPSFPMEAARLSASHPGAQGYHLALGLSDDFLDKFLFETWSSGALCLQVGTETSRLISAQVFSTFIGSLPHLVDGQDVPMLLTLTPQRPAQVRLGKGTSRVAADGTRIPDDPLLTLELPHTQIDFYALIEDRQTRLFSILADVALPLSLDVDPVTRMLQPVLASATSILSNVQAGNAEIVAEDPDQLAQVIQQVLALVQPQLASALSPIALPSVQGLDLDILATAGVGEMPGESARSHLALFAALSTGQPLSYPVDTQVSRWSRRTGNGTIEADVSALRGGSSPTSEFSLRVDGGLWSDWAPASQRALLQSPLFDMQGTHLVEVRARAAGQPASVDPTPAQWTMVVDDLPPGVRLERDPETRAVRTVARDLVATSDVLQARYRIQGAEWTAWDRPREVAGVELESNPSVEVEVRDPAGNIGRAVYGWTADEASELNASARRRAAASLPSDGGCSSTAGLAPAAAALLLACRMRRRRT